MQDNSSESNEKAISFCFQSAIKKLDRVDANVEKKKKQIVQDLAKSLEGKIPTDRIATEITHQLHGKVSERLVDGCLDEKYKQKHRVENARKRKKKHQHTENLAALILLEEKPQQQIAATKDGKSVIINETSSDTDTVSSDVVNRLHEESNQNGFAQSKEGSSITPSLNDAIAFPIKQTKVLTDTKKQVFVSHIPMPFVPLQRDMTTVFKITIIKIEFCGITEQKDVAMTSTGKGVLKEA
jgi:hypothetical protein